MKTKNSIKTTHFVFKCEIWLTAFKMYTMWCDYSPLSSCVQKDRTTTVQEGLSDQRRSGVEIVDGGGPQVVWIVSLCHLLG